MAHLIKRLSPRGLYYYTEVIVSAPCQTHDYVVHIMVSQYPKTNIITVSAPCVTNFMPNKEIIARITHSIGKWTIIPWFTNLFATQGLMEAFQRLKIYLQQLQAKNIKAGFVQD